LKNYVTDSHRKVTIMFNTKRFLCLSLAVLALSGCDLAKNHTKIDREGNREFQDYRDAMAPRLPDVSDMDPEVDEIPPLMSYVAPVSDNLKPMPLVSVNLNQSVPLRDALFELAKEADYDLELDPNIRGSIIFTARNKPFDQVVERIADIAGLRYKFNEDTVRIELDSAYSKTYKIDYLNMIRNSNSSISNDVSVVSGEGTDTGSQYSTETISENNFWLEMESNISQILNVPASYNNLRTLRDPRLTVTNPQPVAVERTGAAGEEGAAVVEGAEGEPTAVAQPQEVSEPPQAVLEVESLPLDEETNQNNRGGNNNDEPEISFSINKQAGALLVYAPQRMHEQVQSYLELVKKAITSQVLIEAKVLEVTLRDEFSAGINWDSFDILGGDVALGFSSGNVTDTVRGTFDPTISPDTNFRLGFFGNDAQAVVDAVSRFGVVKALASPRLTVLNNQQAVLNVATNLVYFEIDIETTSTDAGTETEIDSEIRNVPEGVLINVQPSIDLETGTISMAVRPTITRVVSSVADPAVAFAAARAGASDIQSLIPQVNVQEIDSVIRMHSGQAVVMGGLMQDRVESTQNGVPALSELPLAGVLFRNQNDVIEKTELVIFLKATIIEGSDSIHNTDRDLYKMFSSDRRPLDM
jgi:general secretion pathway protein D